MNVVSRNNVHVSGSGPATLVFAHGFGCDQNMWRFVAPAFEAEGPLEMFGEEFMEPADVWPADVSSEL